MDSLQSILGSRRDDGIMRLQSGSPAIEAAVGMFPAVTVDLDGQPRADKKDKGADEFSSEPIIARILSPNDVGPNAKSSFQRRDSEVVLTSSHDLTHFHASESANP